ncbi:MAG: homoserine dehydrogenase [Gemmatimonadota bacterium]|jgi:homoserine dehydrogenase|nr:homoserine dehydrogenase [Gemmatimonadota bacterium]MDP7032548.1 homoserine dehydrogenase [Gemmatimonadota bacterium]
MTHKLALIGFGTVGQGLLEILLARRDALREDYGFDWELVAVSDFMKGSVRSAGGLDATELLRLAAGGTSLEEYSGDGSLVRGDDALATIRECGADTVCELSYTDVKTGEPATSHCRAALSAGMNVVTSNKGPAALAYPELAGIAASQGVRFLIEGTVMSGTPVLNLADGPLAGCRIDAIRGILNGTTNYILSEMEAGAPYGDVLTRAQELGYAEADPTGDVEGFDAMAKVIILANVVMGASIGADDVVREGITGITPDMIAEATGEGARWKLIGSVERDGDGVRASVTPEKVPFSHPLAGVMGATNALTFTTDHLGDVTIVGPGAGRAETGYSILTDILAIAREQGGASS